MRRILLLSLIIGTYLIGFGQTKIQLPSIFSDHIVLQQKMQVPIWGTALSNSVIKVQIAGYTNSTKANADGKWMLRLPEMNAGGPFELKVWDTDTIRIKDVMIGEVWLASGQSNMDMPVRSTIGPNYEKEIAGENYPNIRFFNPTCSIFYKIAEKSGKNEVFLR